MLSKKAHYLQIALNSNLWDAREIITSLPASHRILLEAGTPLIKEFGANAITQIRNWWQARLTNIPVTNISASTYNLLSLIAKGMKPHATKPQLQQLETESSPPYIIADLKAMDRGEREVQIAANAGAAAGVVLGLAPIETINAFIDNCREYGIDAMVDMMNVEKPYQILRKLKQLPDVVILHRGVDETKLGNKPLPIHLINKIKGAFDVKDCPGVC